MTRIAVVGAAGRMGKTLIEAVVNNENLTLGAATERLGSSLIGADAGELAGVGKLDVAISDDLEKVVDDFDVVIDFTAPVATLNHLDICDLLNLLDARRYTSLVQARYWLAKVHTRLDPPQANKPSIIV